MKDTKRKGSQPMPPVVRKLGPGVTVREKKAGQVESDEKIIDVQPSEQVFRRQR